MDDYLRELIVNAAKSTQTLLWYYEAKGIKEEDNSSKITILEDFSGGDKGGEKQMPPKYADGSFRIINKKTGLLQYRFMFRGQQVPVYGYSEKECWERRFYYKPKDKVNKKPKVEEKIITKTTNEPAEIQYKKWSDIWLKEKEKAAKPGYFKTLKMYLKNDILPKLGKYNLKEFTPLNLQNFLIAIEKDAKRTKVAAILSESLRRAYELQYIPFNPFLGVRFKAYEPPHKAALTHKQQLVLLNSINDKTLLDLTKLLLLTGIRQGEALALTPSDIREDRIRITKTWDKTIKKALPPKTKAGNRTVPINMKLYNILKPYMGQERLFTYDNDYLYGTYSELFKALKIDATGHTLRHTFATNCYEIGVPPHIVQRWMGHSKPEQIDTYLDLRETKDFIKTDIVKYMLELKDKVVPKF